MARHPFLLQDSAYSLSGKYERSLAHVSTIIIEGLWLFASNSSLVQYVHDSTFFEYRKRCDMATTEHTINDAIAELLRGTRWAWRGFGCCKIRKYATARWLSRESARYSNCRTSYGSPVVIETEVLPAVLCRSRSALARLGADLSGSGRTILSSIAVRLAPTIQRCPGTTHFR